MRATVCSAAATMFDCGALATTMPRLVAAATSTLSTPIPARPMTFRPVRAGDEVGGELRRRADEDRVVAPDARRELLVAPVRRDVDLEALAQERDARVGDLLGDEDLVLRLEHGQPVGAAAGTPASPNTRWAAPTPAPCSTSWPSWESAISRPESEVRMSKAPK